MENRPSKNQLLLYIQQVSLICLDLGLFLDTHPHDEKAHECFLEHLTMRNEAVNEYERCYGPLTLNSLSCSSMESWKWVEQPWPWEVMKGGCC